VQRVASLLCVGALVAGTTAGMVAASSPRVPKAERRQIETAYFEDRLVNFTLVPPEQGQRSFLLGVWDFGVRLKKGKPRDQRPNLYLVAPGTQHHVDGWEQYDHNDVLSFLPAPKAVREWDVYWAIVLDPTLREDFRGERELLIATQDGFTPGEDVQLSDIPGADFLRAFLKVKSLVDLGRYQRPDGQLPRLLIVPAGFAVRGSATVPEIQEAQNAPAQSTAQKPHPAGAETEPPHDR
jgi:hypothetical protein